ncbi:hypothetical protein PL11201_690094 [Planktothrix sp. PCC 11201]|nr:hypothetical protein PL11201_690094 [Planktothrix sp. PCC 11201]
MFFLSLNLAGTPSLLIEDGITIFVNWVEINQIFRNIGTIWA